MYDGYFYRFRLFPIFSSILGITKKAIIKHQFFVRNRCPASSKRLWKLLSTNRRTVFGVIHEECKVGRPIGPIFIGCSAKNFEVLSHLHSGDRAPFRHRPALSRPIVEHTVVISVIWAPTQKVPIRGALWSGSAAFYLDNLIARQHPGDIASICSIAIILEHLTN